jgi:hypothetical protein
MSHRSSEDNMAIPVNFRDKDSRAMHEQTFFFSQLESTLAEDRILRQIFFNLH